MIIPRGFIQIEWQLFVVFYTVQFPCPRDFRYNIEWKRDEILSYGASRIAKWLRIPVVTRDSSHYRKLRLGQEVTQRRTIWRRIETV
ncbi:MAG: hypothetical protein GTN81_03115 [Proteobacteria bacterium]|nr:hypothetical protein [Pseudomonadota bacterium]